MRSRRWEDSRPPVRARIRTGAWSSAEPWGPTGGAPGLEGRGPADGVSRETPWHLRVNVEDELDSGLAPLHLALPEGGREHLRRYARMLAERGPALGVIAASDANRVLRRH